MYFLIIKAPMLRPEVGKKAMLDKTGLAIKDIATEGKIRKGASTRQTASAATCASVPTF